MLQCMKMEKSWVEQRGAGTDVQSSYGDRTGHSDFTVHCAEREYGMVYGMIAWEEIVSV